MDKTNRTEFRRVFLLEALPEPLTRASAHIQIFDNYIDGTRLRIRSVRDPQTSGWTRILQQRFAAVAGELSALKVAEIYLNDEEHARLQHLEGEEIRKNRYFHEFDGRMFAFDVYLGPLWGVNTARVEFESAEELERFEPPPWILLDVTNDEFFLGDNLVKVKFDDVREHLGSFSGQISAAVAGDE
jgi:CYTH domain-containing protein